MGRTSGSTIAMSLLKTCPSSNPCLPQKGTPPKAFLQVMTPARSVEKVLFIGELSCWDKEGETDKEKGQDGGMNGKETWN